MPACCGPVGVFLVWTQKGRNALESESKWFGRIFPSSRSFSLCVSERKITLRLASSAEEAPGSLQTTVSDQKVQISPHWISLQYLRILLRTHTVLPRFRSLFLYIYIYNCTLFSPTWGKYGRLLLCSTSLDSIGSMYPNLVLTEYCPASCFFVFF